MPSKKKTIPKVVKKVTTVHAHPMHVPVSKKNPSGITIRDQHPRRLNGTYLDLAEIEAVAKNYDRKKLIYPSKNKLDTKVDSNHYDELIAIWTDYFNKKFNTIPPLDPDMVKTLIYTETDFVADPKTKIAFGLTQITKPTLEALQDPKGEAKEFIFNKIKQKDLSNPDVAIPLGVRWLFRKRDRLNSILKRSPADEELAMEYKGLLNSKSKYHDDAVKKFRKGYAILKNK